MFIQRSHFNVIVGCRTLIIFQINIFSSDKYRGGGGGGVMDRCGRHYVLNAVSANVCIKIGPPLGPKTGCLRT